MTPFHSEQLWHNIKTKKVEANNYQLMYSLARVATPHEVLEQFERTAIDHPPAALRLAAILSKSLDPEVRALVADRVGEFQDYPGLTSFEKCAVEGLITRMSKDPDIEVRNCLAESTDPTVYH